MEKFTQLGLSSKPDVKPSPNLSTPEPLNGKKSASTKKTAAFVASSVAGSLLAIFLLQTSGCSKENNKSIAPLNQTLLNQPASSVSSPSSSAAVTTQAVTQPAPKKVVKRRPSTVAYNDPAYGVSFRYPRKYTLKTPDAAKPETVGPQPFDMNFVQPGGVQIASIELPKGAYPGTDLAAASFNVSVNKTMTADQCGQFTLLQLASSDDLSVQPAKIKFAGEQLEEMEAISGPDGKQADAKYFHLFQNGACYEFALGLSTQSDGNEDGVMPVDREDVFRRLERILATVKITTETPAIAEAPAAAPASTAEAVPATPTASATPDVAVKQ